MVILMLPEKQVFISSKLLQDPALRIGEDSYVKDPSQIMKDPAFWGLSWEFVGRLAVWLSIFLEGWKEFFQVRSWDRRFLCGVYLTGLLTMTDCRNFKNISRFVMDDDDGQKLQQFMSDSPWKTEPIYRQIQREIAKSPVLRGGMLIVDSSGNKRAQGKSAGGARQYCGREGKIDFCQDAMGLAYYRNGIWAAVDSKLYFPKEWFEEDRKKLWKSLRIPEDQEFKKKTDMAVEMILNAKANGLPFRMVCFDDTFGQKGELRNKLADNNIFYIADIPRSTTVYTEEPKFCIPENKPGKRGPKFKNPRVVESIKPIQVHKLTKNPSCQFQECRIRPCERGFLVYLLHFKRVWIVTDDGRVWPQWLIIRKEGKNKHSYSLSNVPEDFSLEELAVWRSHRYFVERTFQDMKSDLGWNELQAVKYRAWDHHTALVALAMLFIAKVKLLNMFIRQKNQSLYDEYKIKILPNLSAKNIRELLTASLQAMQVTSGNECYDNCHSCHKRCSDGSFSGRLTGNHPEKAVKCRGSKIGCHKMNDGCHKGNGGWYKENDNVWHNGDCDYRKENDDHYANNTAESTPNTGYNPFAAHYDTETKIARILRITVSKLIARYKSTTCRLKKQVKQEKWKKMDKL